MLPNHPDDRYKVVVGDFVRLCNCDTNNDEVCIKAHARGIFLGKKERTGKQKDLLDMWTLWEDGREVFYLCTYPVRIINESRRLSKK
jgi:hypothetical protein